MNHPLTLVVARFNEDLEWIVDLPPEIHVVIYNKGRLIESLAVLRRADLIEDRENIGRESETYFHHLSQRSRFRSEWTVFTQGDPFEHSPDFLQLLQLRDLWKPVQALSCRWLVGRQIPPDILIRQERDEWLADTAKVRTELFSLLSLLPPKYADPGMTVQHDSYCGKHGLETGSNTIAHFLEIAGLRSLAAEARSADFGRFGYSAIFAVHETRIGALDEGLVLKNLMHLTATHFSHGCICERLWLHFFGEPFVRIESRACSPK